MKTKRCDAMWSACRPLGVAVVCLTLSAGGARAQAPSDPWTLAGRTPALSLSIDRASLVRDGDIRRIRELQDLSAPDPDGVLSRVYQNEYDCRNGMHRIGMMSSFEGARLSGRRLFDVQEMGYWRKIPAAGLFTLVYRMLCQEAPAS